jgi:glycosyltransferase involved in cell wall biosynthesis
LGRCLESLKKQTSQPDEIIVVNNNSTDKTVEIAENYGIKVVKCKKQGISSARNYGAEKAKGNIIAFLDADGVANKKWVEEIKKHFSKTKNCDALCGINIFDSKNPFRLFFYNLYNLVTFPLTWINNSIGKYFVTGNNMAIKKDLFIEAGKFPNYIAEDIKLGKNLRKFHPLKIKSDIQMRVIYSSRRFEKNGFFKTLIPWISYSFFKDKDDLNYKENY